MTLSVLGQQDVGRKRHWARQNKMLEKAKKPLGTHDVGRQRGWQPGRWATKAMGDQHVRQRQDIFEQQTRWTAGRSDFY